MLMLDDQLTFAGAMGFRTRDDGCISCNTGHALRKAGFPFLSHNLRRTVGAHWNSNCSAHGIPQGVIFQPDFHIGV
jgi:cytochrome c peroxidase